MLRPQNGSEFPDNIVQPLSLSSRIDQIVDEFAVEDFAHGSTLGVERRGVYSLPVPDESPISFPYLVTEIVSSLKGPLRQYHRLSRIRLTDDYNDKAAPSLKILSAKNRINMQLNNHPRFREKPEELASHVLAVVQWLEIIRENPYFIAEPSSERAKSKLDLINTSPALLTHFADEKMNQLHLEDNATFETYGLEPYSKLDVKHQGKYIALTSTWSPVGQTHTGLTMVERKVKFFNNLKTHGFTGSFVEQGNYIDDQTVERNGTPIDTGELSDYEDRYKFYSQLAHAINLAEIHDKRPAVQELYFPDVV